MSVNELWQSIRDSLPGTFECVLTPNGIGQVPTAMLYPEGDVEDVYVKARANGYVVTDFGDVLRWLQMQSASGRLSPKQRLMLDDVLHTQGVDSDRGQLRTKCEDIGTLGEAVQRVTQSAVRVSVLSEGQLNERPSMPKARIDSR